MSAYRDFFNEIETQQRKKGFVTPAGAEGREASENIKQDSLVSNPNKLGSSRGLASDIVDAAESAAEGIKGAYDNVLEWFDVSFGYEEKKKKDTPNPDMDGGFLTEGDTESSSKVSNENSLRVQERARDKQFTTPDMGDLEKDRTFKDGLMRLKKAHPNMPEDKFKNMINGESAGDTSARNKNSGAVSLWQITPIALKDLKKQNLVSDDLTLSAIRGMDAGQQMDLYSTYLDRWGYDGSQSLGVLQAAPAFRDAPLSTIIYKKGSDQWNQNPGWRPRSGGDITGQSIDNYYFGRAPKTSLRPLLRPKELEKPIS